MYIADRKCSANTLYSEAVTGCCRLYLISCTKIERIYDTSGKRVVVKKKRFLDTVQRGSFHLLKEIQKSSVILQSIFHRAGSCLRESGTVPARSVDKETSENIQNEERMKWENKY